MTEQNWIAVIAEEDRLIANSDRRFRYHCYSLESMSEELAFQERQLNIQEDFTSQIFIKSFIDTVQNERLAYGLRCLTNRQRRAIELHFWEGYQYKEMAVMLHCDPSAVSHLMARALKELRKHLADR